MSREFFDEVYRKPDYYGTDVRPEFIRFLDMLGAGRRRIVDLGCGQGRHALVAARRGVEVHAVDQSAVALRQLAETAAADDLPITTAIADLSSIRGFEQAFDGAVMVTSLDHLTLPQMQVLEEALRAGLKPGAMLYVEAFTVEDPGYRGGAPASETRAPVRHYFGKGELAGTFRRWEIVESREFAERDEGHGHAHLHGMALLIARNPPA